MSKIDLNDSKVVETEQEVAIALKKLYALGYTRTQALAWVDLVFDDLPDEEV